MRIKDKTVMDRMNAEPADKVLSELEEKYSNANLKAVMNWGYIPCQPHDCLTNSKVIRCNNVTDICECSICKKVWSEPCSVDEDYD